jgi:hypothetical protein
MVSNCIFVETESAAASEPTASHAATCRTPDEPRALAKPADSQETDERAAQVWTHVAGRAGFNS